MYAHLMVHFDIEADAAPLIEFAGKLAERFNAYVTGIVATRPLVTETVDTPIPQDVIDRDIDEKRAKIDSLEKTFRTALCTRRERLDFRSQISINPPTDFAVRQMRSADLLVTGINNRQRWLDPLQPPNTADLIIEVGRPGRSHPQPAAPDGMLRIVFVLNRTRRHSRLPLRIKDGSRQGEAGARRRAQASAQRPTSIPDSRIHRRPPLGHWPVPQEDPEMPSNAPRQMSDQDAHVHSSAGTPPEVGAADPDMQFEAKAAPPYFEREHRRLATQFHEHLLDVAGGSFILARQHVQRWRRALARHIRIEDSRLLPHVPPGARWSARLYRLEHARITAMADAYAARVDAVSENLPRDERSRRETILTLLDAARALRHLLEHHHQREEMALAMELPAALQETAWGYGNGRARRGERV